jgi:hypothetical protein
MGFGHKLSVEKNEHEIQFLMALQLPDAWRFREWKKIFCSCSRRRESALIWVPTDDNARTNVRGYTILFQKRMSGFGIPDHSGGASQFLSVSH